jgi:hypothetical protein
VRSRERDSAVERLARGGVACLLLLCLIDYVAAFGIGVWPIRDEAIAGGALFGGLLWAALAPRLVRAGRERAVDHQIDSFVRYGLAAIFVLYGMAKVLRTQFGPPMFFELDTPLRELTGFQLTWRFFGHSYAYALFVAGSQLAAAALLCFRRTQLLGAWILLPVIANIVVVNFTHGVPVRFMSVVFLLVTVHLIALERRRLVAVFWSGAATPPGRPSRPGGRRRAALQALFLAAVTALVTLKLQSLIADHHRPTPVRGGWEMVEMRAARAALPDDWRRLYFEDFYVAPFNVGAIRTTHRPVRFRYSASASPPRLRVVFPGGAELRGRYHLEGETMPRLTVTGTYRGEPLTLVLRRLD